VSEFGLYVNKGPPWNCKCGAHTGIFGAPSHIFLGSYSLGLGEKHFFSARNTISHLLGALIGGPFFGGKYSDYPPAQRCPLDVLPPQKGRRPPPLFEQQERGPSQNKLSRLGVNSFLGNYSTLHILAPEVIFDEQLSGERAPSKHAGASACNQLV